MKHDFAGIFNINFLAYLVFLASCDTGKLCGEPEGKQKIFIDSINAGYHEKLTIKQVPCYPGYIQVDLKTEVPTQLLDSIEASSGKLQWTEFLVYDKNGTLIRGNTGSM